MSATTTEILTKRKTLTVEKAQYDEERQELESRGLLNSDYGLIKKVVGEQMVVSFAALTAVLLQIAHPGVGRGVGLHSNFAYRFIERHENTVMYIYVMVFGTEEQRAKMKKFVDKRHKYVNDNKREKTYNALDPKLQLWVAFTLYATYVPVYEELFGKFTDEERERVLQEFSIMGTSLQVPLHMWPRSVVEADAYWTHIVNDVLEMTEPCKKTTWELQNAASFVPWYLRPAASIAVPLRWTASTERLPERIRGLYNLKSTAWTRGINTTTFNYLWYSWYLLPDSVRRWQVKHYMDKAERLMNKGRLA